MGDVEELLNDSIATEGYRIGPASNPEALVNLSEIDFEALQAKFAQGHKRTEAEKLKRLIEGKLAQMVAVNASRMDLAEKFQKLIDEYNAGSRNIEAFFAELKDFTAELTVEEQRGDRRGPYRGRARAVRHPDPARAGADQGGGGRGQEGVPGAAGDAASARSWCWTGGRSSRPRRP